MNFELAFDELIEGNLVTNGNGVISIDALDELKSLQKRQKEAVTLFTILITGISFWIFVYAIWEQLNQFVSFALLSDFLVFVATGMFVIYYKLTGLTKEEVGLAKGDLVNNLVKGLVMGLIGLSILAVVKLTCIKLGFYPEGTPIFNLRLFTYNEIIYIPLVFLQELASRGMVFEGMNRLIGGRKGAVISLLLSSFFFGALHIHGGLVYMFGAAFMLGILGLIYMKQRSIWGLCVAHYILGIGLVIVNF